MASTMPSPSPAASASAYPSRRSWVLPVAAMVLATGCAAPLQRVTPATPAARTVPGPAPLARTSVRPTVGLALGGGSARGLAHVGVIRWLEEHRVPIDAVAGTSMGGLVGGAYATGMDADRLDAFVQGLDWDHLFGESTYAYKNIRRKHDARAFPSRLEFGLRRGIVAPPSLNSGAGVELMLARITAPYFDLETFDGLPTPFRSVAVDLLSAKPVVLHDGSLADAMRATMSIPLVFPPVDVDGQVLVDGGAMNNVPADVVKDMGVDKVIAINVGDLADRDGVSYTLLGLVGSTLDAMMRASTLRALASADVVVNVPLKEYGSLDWRRAADLIEAGYRAAEDQREQLLPLAVDESTFAAWRADRQTRRRATIPPPARVTLQGFGENDSRRLEALLSRHVDAPLDVAALEADVAIVAGLDRYETVTWRLARDPGGAVALVVRGKPKPFAPPFLMLGFNLENTTSSDFRITTTARYLAFDAFGSGSELRVDGTLGSDPGAGGELYRPIGRSPFFVAPFAGVGTTTFNLIEDDAVVARYKQTSSRLGLSVGANLGARSDVRISAHIGRETVAVTVGDPGSPEARGRIAGGDLTWRLDTQDSPVVPSTGVHVQARLARTFEGPDITIAGQPVATGTSLTSAAALATSFWSPGSDDAHRVFVTGVVGGVFSDEPLETPQFALGVPFRLGAYSPGQLRGAQYYAATGGYLRRVARLPDFLGGPIFAGGWLESGDAFAEWSRIGWRGNGGVGVVMDTLLGPVVVAGSWGFDGRWRTYFGVGRVFR
jgi:NTE family protein